VGAHLTTAYHCVLERFGAEAQEFKITDNIGSFVEWLNNELKLLLDTISKVGDYGGLRALKPCCTFWSNKVAGISRPLRAGPSNSPPPKICLL
jgi:hypothetical protein